MASRNWTLQSSTDPSDGEVPKYDAATGRLVFGSGFPSFVADPLPLLAIDGVSGDVASSTHNIGTEQRVMAMLCPFGGTIDRLAVSVSAFSNTPSLTVAIFQTASGALYEGSAIPKILEAEFTNVAANGWQEASFTAAELLPGYVWIVSRAHDGTSIGLGSYSASGTTSNPLTNSAIGTEFALFGKLAFGTGIDTTLDPTVIIAATAAGPPILRLRKS